MKNIIQFYVFLIITLLNIGFSPIEAASKQYLAGAPGLAVCEVNSYSEYSLKQEYFHTLEEYLTYNFYRSKKFRVKNKLRFKPTLADGSVIDLGKFFKELHQQAIIKGKNFRQEEANPEFAEYWRLHSCKKSTIESYVLNQDFKQKVAYLGKQNNVKYLVFCNLKIFDVKESPSNVPRAIGSVEGFKVKVDMDYYLVNTENGMVYEGNSITDKATPYHLDLIIGRTGRPLNILQLEEALLKEQAYRASEDIYGKGLKLVKK